MANLPNKIKSGDTFRSSVVNTINNIIDYLSSQRIKGDGKTLKINQYANGITLSAIVNNDKSMIALVIDDNIYFNNPLKILIESLNGL